MMFVSDYHAMIDHVLAASGVSDKMMHMHVGMAIFLASQLCLRTRRGSVDALWIVIAAEAFNEVMDRLFWGSWQVRDTLGDIAATIVWPTLIVLVSRYRRRRWSALNQGAHLAKKAFRPAVKQMAVR